MSALTDDRYLPSGNEVGSAPGDRRFRPDVQGLRAVAILLVVLFHAGVSTFSGGFVGVDVFFAISGFVITGLLLRERASSNATSMLSFYARRVRRILPSATLIIVVTVAVARIVLTRSAANGTAVDGQWASVFLTNFHFIADGSNYLASLKPPSPLQNLWSLAVEEQFYIVYPAAFLLVACLHRWSLRTRLALMLGFTVIGSYALSIVMTPANPANAFFSPFTRAWELALGALVALFSDMFRHLPNVFAAILSWLGLGAVFFGRVRLQRDRLLTLVG